MYTCTFVHTLFGVYMYMYMYVHNFVHKLCHNSIILKCKSHEM